jgi:SAM-dependent methyltransferase/uncharacterized protein YbaR (Trm112 family)
MVRGMRNLLKWWNFPQRHNIDPSSAVLDVGCGNWPNMRANVLADKFIIDDTERPHPLVIGGRPFVVCDAYRLPFRDQAFSYVICSHLAEHLDRPEDLLGELARVAQAGYVECPDRIREHLHGWDFHRWFVRVESDTIVFEEKDRAITNPELHEWFSRLFEGDPKFERFFVDNIERYGLVAAYDWKGRIEYQVKRNPNSTWERTTATLERRGPITRGELVEMSRRVSRPHCGRNEFVKDRLSKFARRRSDARTIQQLRSLLCCPVCHSELVDGPIDVGELSGLICPRCNADFPVVGSIFYLMPEQVLVPAGQPSLLS